MIGFFKSIFVVRFYNIFMQIRLVIFHSFRCFGIKSVGSVNVFRIVEFPAAANAIIVVCLIFYLDEYPRLLGIILCLMQ